MLLCSQFVVSSNSKVVKIYSTDFVFLNDPTILTGEFEMLSTKCVTISLCLLKFLRELALHLIGPYIVLFRKLTE